MALQRLEALAVLEADQMFRGQRLLHRHGRFGRLKRRLGAAARHPHQRGMDLADEVRDFRGLGRIVAEIGRYDIGGQFDGRLAGGIGHGSTFWNRERVTRIQGSDSIRSRLYIGKTHTTWQIWTKYREIDKNRGALFSTA